MTVAAAPTGNNLRLWVASGAVVLGLHAAGAALLVTWHDPVAIGEPSSAIVVDLAPFTTPPSDSQEDITPGPKQQETDAPPPEPPKLEKNDDEKVDVPPAPVPPVAALPPPEPIERPVPPPAPPVPATTAPPRQRIASAAEVASWHRRIVAQIERHKTYPEAARMHREKGVVEIAFSLDRQGRVTAHRIARASGYAALDEAAMATVARAQPFPPPPEAMSGDAFNFTVPVQFSIR
jgi:protein TonB